MTITITPFEPRSLASLSFAPHFDEVRQLLGAKSITLTIADAASG